MINLVTKDAEDFLGEGEWLAVRLKVGYDSNPDGWLGSAIAAMSVVAAIERQRGWISL